MKKLLALIILLASPCFGQELILRGGPPSARVQKRAVYLGGGHALTTFHAETGHETIQLYEPTDWRLIRVPDDLEVKAAKVYHGKLKVGQAVWNRGKWGKVWMLHDGGVFNITNRAVPGDSGSGVYDEWGRCVGIVTHKTGAGARCVNPYYNPVE